MDTQTLDAAEWRERCALRLRELDLKISVGEAEALAGDVHAFERTRAMEPEAAADFVAEQMSQPKTPRFERRSKSRSEQAPFMRAVPPSLTEPRNSP